MHTFELLIQERSIGQWQEHKTIPTCSALVKEENLLTMRITKSPTEETNYPCKGEIN